VCSGTYYNGVKYATADLSFSRFVFGYELSSVFFCMRGKQSSNRKWKAYYSSCTFCSMDAPVNR